MDRIDRLERQVRWLRRVGGATVFGLLLAAVATCGSGGFSTSGTQEQVGLLMAKEIRVGDEQANVRIVGNEIRMTRKDGGWVTVEPTRIRFHARDGAELASFTVEHQPEIVLQRGGKRFVLPRAAAPASMPHP